MCYELSEVWLCKLTQVVQRKGRTIDLVEFEPVYLLIECNRDQDSTSEEVPAFKSFISGEEYYDGLKKGVYNLSDIDKIFVTERIQLPLNVLEPNEVFSGTISEERLHSLYKMMFYSKLLS